LFSLITTVYEQQLVECTDAVLVYVILEVFVPPNSIVHSM